MAQTKQTLTTQELISQGYSAKTALNHPANVANQVPKTLTTEELMAQGYPEDVAKRHPANSLRQDETSQTTPSEELEPISTKPEHIIGGIALAAANIELMNENTEPYTRFQPTEQPVRDTYGNVMTPAQFAAINGDPDTRMQG